MEEEKNTNKGNLKKMLSWSSDSDDSENEDGENKDTTKVPEPVSILGYFLLGTFLLAKKFTKF